ncbi:hypothetical protein BZA77DRAFT_296853 [Pyronema omphalodes]|nr:hypothetical protein BZA77DRAFT_296853 [Pyronema omphalodes]
MQILHAPSFLGLLTLLNLAPLVFCEQYASLTFYTADPKPVTAYKIEILEWDTCKEIRRTYKGGAARPVTGYTVYNACCVFYKQDDCGGDPFQGIEDGFGSTDNIKDWKRNKNKEAEFKMSKSYMCSRYDHKTGKCDLVRDTE